MNPYITELLVRDHIDALRREAEREALTRTARSGRPPRSVVASFMPHVPDGGRLGRVVASLVKPALG